MRLRLLTMMTFLCSTIFSVADKLTIENATIPKGGLGTIVINYQFDVANQYSGWQFSLGLPGGLSTVKNDKGTSQFTVGTCHDSSYTITSSYSEGIDNYVALSLESSPITGVSGILLSIPVIADEEHEVGAEFQASLTGIQFGNKDGVQTSFFDDVNFTVTIGEPADIRVVLDDNATVLPAAATDVNVRVKRTIKAGEWSTICLPFAMTEAQVKTAFGNDVQIADFVNTQSTYDDDDRVVGISISFNDVAAIEANHPYIIKVSQPVTEFTVDDVDIDPAEDDALVEVDNGLTGRHRVVFGGMYGTYHAQTVLENQSLFLNDNKFWYSTGLTKMKAFRAYFVMLDVLTDVEEASARISINFDNEENTTTGITDKWQEMNHGDTYNLQGMRVKPARKGLYVRNGKKIIVR